MPTLVKNALGVRETGYLAKEDLQAFLENEYGTGINFQLKVWGAVFLQRASRIPSLTQNGDRQTKNERWEFWTPEKVSSVCGYFHP